jgi:hypothetical protein
LAQLLSQRKEAWQRALRSPDAALLSAALFISFAKPVFFAKKYCYTLLSVVY